jgi:signal peptidase II
MSDSAENLQSTEAPEANPVPAAAAVAEGLRPGTFFVCVLLVFLSDQLSKHWIVSHLYLGEVRPIFGNAFRLMLTHNTGGAWGLLPQGNTIFAGFAGVAALALVVAYMRVGRMEIAVGSAFALALGGAIGNLLDRVRIGYVVDFFDARIINWPIFNVADSAITISILLLLVHFVRSPSAPPAEAAVTPAPEAAAAPIETSSEEKPS